MNRTKKQEEQTRRNFVVLAGAATAGCVLPACGSKQNVLTTTLASTCSPDMKDTFAVPDAIKLNVNQAMIVSDPTLMMTTTIIARDERGFMAIWAYCQHAGCVVGLNTTAGTYDCPCHGSRYEFDGAIKNGPTNFPLKHLGLCRQNGVLTVQSRNFLPGIDQRSQ